MPENIVGPQIRRLRYQRGMTQDALAAKCTRLGWDVSRGTIAKVEARVRCVKDEELLIIARALKVRADELFPLGPRPRRN